MIGELSVAHVTTVHHPLDPRISRKEVATLRKAGLRTWLIARDPGIEHPTDFFALPPAAGSIGRLRRHLHALRHLRRLRPHVVHIHDPELIPIAWFMRRLNGAKVIYDMHEDYAGRRKRGGRLLRMLERWCFRWVDHVILAEASYDRILKGRSTRSTPVLNYVLPEHEATLNSTPDPFTLIYTGTLSNCRGLSRMVDLAAEIKRRQLPWRLIVAGVSYLRDERKAAEQRVRDEGLDGVIERIGWESYVPWPELARLYERAHIGLALFEPLPNHTGSILSKFYEYIYFGLPIVASNFPLWEAFLKSNGCGVCVDRSDMDSIVMSLQELERDGRYDAIRARAMAARRGYLWSEMERRLLDIYEDVLGVRIGPAGVPTDRAQSSSEYRSNVESRTQPRSS